MRLRKIHLAGFKSFVDSTTIELPGDFIGIVGPNGCGKSNVIDAVRWVMGESSAKHLRGDMMADVIFNGSISRKPVGQASVELVFDNAEGRLGERFAAYSEISVRRQVNRDGQSIFMLNGARCRRRDITDVFLGTGLGPRSYAIIEQGTISRLVEARPEDLREFLEEAAGISRYKERRRETENRIRHTNENLDRLSDLREELASQIERLRRQAAQAERFKGYKAEERKLRSEVLALRWSGLNEQVQLGEQTIAAQSTKVESAMARQRSTEADLEQQRSQQAEATDGFNARYREVLEAGAAVARTEESIQHLRRQRDGLVETLAHEKAALEDAGKNATDDAARLGTLRQSLSSDQPELERHEELTAQAREDYERVERNMLAFQQDWDQLNARLEEPTRTAHREGARLQALAEQKHALDERRGRLAAEQSELQGAGPSERLALVGQQLERVRVARQVAEAQLAQIQAEISAAREREADLSSRLDGARRDVHELGGKRASLEALQQAALIDGSEEVAAWLSGQGLSESMRLAEAIRVRPGWERAVEVVLAEHLQAVVVKDLEVHLSGIDGLTEGVVGLIEAAAEEADQRTGPIRAHALRDFVEEGEASIRGHLVGVYGVETLDAALAMRVRLGEQESVVTRSGLWFGKGWVRIVRGAAAAESVLEREQVLREVRDAVRNATVVRDEMTRQVESLRGRLGQDEGRRAEAQSALSRSHERYAALRSEVSAAQAEVEQRAARARDVGAELIELNVSLDTAIQHGHEANARLAQALQQCKHLEQEREGLVAQRQSLQQGLSQAREQWQGLRQGAYECGLRVESTRSQIVALEEAQARVDAQVEGLVERVTRFQGELTAIDEPIEQAEERRQRLLVRHAELEAALRGARSGLEAGDMRLRELEQARLTNESEVETEREELGKNQMSVQEVIVRRQTVAEQIEEHGGEIAQVLAGIEDGANENLWSERLEQLDRRIARLGPINLAAIDEFEQQSERKEYLDAQHADLVAALGTLQEAIRKIDQDTRARFKETYERVNAGLEEKFPRLFGGGQAYLQLTSDDLLATGVAVMARPPGKRNSNIHLLSGGEKALTAVALVFAIFDLNAAPFCLLDEVDAPLDDANVGRFSALVKEMSERVQVMIVTHNKTTMETVQQLIGVTMNEPGVSRLVAVDLDAAVELAAD